MAHLLCNPGTCVFASSNHEKPWVIVEVYYVGLEYLGYTSAYAFMNEINCQNVYASMNSDRWLYSPELRRTQ